MRLYSIQSRIQRGGALVLAMIFITALSIMCIGFITVAQSTRNNSFSAVASEQALRIAETGVADWIQQANQHSVPGSGVLPTFTSVMSLNFPDMQYSAPIATGNSTTITNPVTGQQTNYYQMLFSGTVLNLAAGSGSNGTTTTRYIEAWVSVYPGKPTGAYPVQAFGKASASGFGTPTVDSYNSAIDDPGLGYGSYSYQSTHAPAAGGYAANTTGAFHAGAGGNGNVGSDASISIAGATTVYGNLNPGPGQTVGGSPPGPPPSGVHGQVIPLTSPITFPDPTAMTVPPAGTPALISSPPSVAGSDGTKTVLHVSNISGGFAVHGNVTIYLDGSVSLSGMHNFVSIYPGATLTIYQAQGSGGLSISGSPGFQQVDSSGSATVQQLSNIFNFISAAGPNPAIPATSGYSSSEDWHGNSDWASNVYAPFATVNFTGNGQHYGAVVANNLNVGGVSGLHEDLNAQSPVFATNPLIAIGSMREVVPTTSSSPLFTVTINGTATGFTTLKQ